MTIKTVPFNADGATNLPNNKPVVYRIKTEGNTTNYVGVAQRGRVQERIQEHIHDAQIPGAKVAEAEHPRGKGSREAGHRAFEAAVQQARVAKVCPRVTSFHCRQSSA